MSRIIIAIGMFVLLTTVAAIQDNDSDEVLRLGYNPTYDLWFFMPKGRPEHVPDSVKDAYEEKRTGGVCYKAQDDWFYCATGEKIISQ